MDKRSLKKPPPPTPAACSTPSWETFHEANGARSLPEMCARIVRHRRTDPAVNLH